MHLHLKRPIVIGAIRQHEVLSRMSPIERHGPSLHLIAGGPGLSTAERIAVLAAVEFEPLMGRLAAGQFARRAEADARMAVGVLAPGAAILAKSKAELVELVMADLQEAAETHEALKSALTAANVLVDILRAAEARFLIAMTAAALDVLAKPEGA